MDNLDQNQQHDMECPDSWEGHQARTLVLRQDAEIMQSNGIRRPQQEESQEQKREKKRKKHVAIMKELYNNPGIQYDTMHGLMIDAGSTGSRMHVYEFDQRVLKGEKEIAAAVSGKKISYPNTNSRWTERLQPGLASFASKNDEELEQAVMEYLQPLFDFVDVVLHTKKERFAEYPIYLKATAGMRVLSAHDRNRVMSAVRSSFHNKTFCPFKFEMEQARVISGEEEAIYGWAGVNFVLGSLVKSSEGSGTVVNPKLTHGALEMGGASAQISFYQPNEDIMSSLFKLHIGQGKHWNVYAHSFLYYGVNEAWNRMGARITWDSGKEFRNEVHNPCLPGGTSIDFESDVYFSEGYDTWPDTKSNNTIYHSQLKNDKERGDYEECARLVEPLIDFRNGNAWCQFAHRGDCAFKNIYQPPIPKQSENFGEFLAFSNYYHIFKRLQLPSETSIYELEHATKRVCGMSKAELDDFANGRIKNEEDKIKLCFHATYSLKLLREGHGFGMENKITATNVVKGQKVGWALGSMLYEINTLPWVYIPKGEVKAFKHQIVEDYKDQNSDYFAFFLVVIFGCIAGALIIFVRRQQRDVRRYGTKRSSSSFSQTQYMSVDMGVRS